MCHHPLKLTPQILHGHAPAMFFKKMSISNSLPVSKSLPGMKCLLPTGGGHGHGLPPTTLRHGEALEGTHHQSPTEGGTIGGSCPRGGIFEGGRGQGARALGKACFINLVNFFMSSSSILIFVKY
jgi:hypothetical protein